MEKSDGLKINDENEIDIEEEKIGLRVKKCREIGGENEEKLRFMEKEGKIGSKRKGEDWMWEEIGKEEIGKRKRKIEVEVKKKKMKGEGNIEIGSKIEEEREIKLKRGKIKRIGRIFEWGMKGKRRKEDLEKRIWRKKRENEVEIWRRVGERKGDERGESKIEWKVMKIKEKVKEEEWKIGKIEIKWKIEIEKRKRKIGEKVNKG